MTILVLAAETLYPVAVDFKAKTNLALATRFFTLSTLRPSSSPEGINWDVQKSSICADY